MTQGRGNQQWWKSGYESWTPDAPAAKRDGVRVWPPNDFRVPVADPAKREAQREKKIIFVDDGECFVDVHLFKIPDPTSRFGGQTEEFTCGRLVYGPHCCAERFARRDRGKILKDRPQQTAYYTVIDCESYKDKKGVEHSCAIRRFGVRGDILAKLKRQRDKNGGSLVGAMYSAIRYTDQKSSRVGEDFEFVKKGDLTRIFPVVEYSGHRLPALYEQARRDPTFRLELSKYLALPLGPDGGILDQVPSLNFQETQRPLSPSELDELLGPMPRAFGYAAQGGYDQRDQGGYGGGGSYGNRSTAQGGYGRPTNGGVPGFEDDGEPTYVSPVDGESARSALLVEDDDLPF